MEQYRGKLCPKNGRVKVSKKKAAEIMVEEIKKHIDAGTKLKKIIFSDINEDQVKFFEEEIARLG